MTKKPALPPLEITSTADQLLVYILEEAERQTNYLRGINTVVTLFGLLMLLAVVGWCVVSFLNL